MWLTITYVINMQLIIKDIIKYVNKNTRCNKYGIEKNRCNRDVRTM